MEVSAKTGEGIDSLFNEMVKELLKLKDIGIIRIFCQNFVKNSIFVIYSLYFRYIFVLLR